MLQSIRDRAQNWVFSVIIGLLVIAFAFWGMERFFDGAQASRVIAKVDGHEITQDEFNNTYQRLRRELQLQMGQNFTLTPQLEKNLKQQSLQQLIHSYVLTDVALQQGYRIIPGQIDSVLASIPAFQVNGQFSTDRFQAVLNNLAYSETAFINQLRADMLVNQMQLGMVTSAFALPTDVNDAYQLFNQTRDIQFLLIPVSRYKNAIKVSNADEQNYYAQNQDQFRTPEQVSIEYLELSLKKIAAQQKFSDTQLQRYYQANKDSFTTPEQFRVAQILVRIPPDANKAVFIQTKEKLTKIENALKTESFAQVAKKYSEDITTRDKGGVLPWFSMGIMGSAFEQAASKLKVGEVSAPVQTQFGYNIIKLLAKKPKQIEPYAKVKNQIRDVLAQQQAQKIFADQSEQLSNLTFSDSGSLQNAAQTLGLPIQTTGFFSRKGTPSGLTANAKIVNAAFSKTVLVQNYNSDPIQLNDSTVVVLRIKDHQVAAVKPFAAVQAEIHDLLLLNSAKQQAEALGNKIIEGLRQGTSLKQLANLYQLSMKVITNVGRHDNKINAEILRATFRLPKPKSAAEPSFIGMSLPSGDYSIVMVTKVTEGDAKQMTQIEHKAYSQQLSNAYGQMDFGLFVQQQLKQAKIHLEKTIQSVS